MFNGELELSTAFSPVDWHVHEMLYGYLPSVVAGFLLTAIPNWTGRLPIQGVPLLVLVLVWAAGRVCVTFSAETGWLLAAIIDVSFLALVVAAAMREIVAGKNWRNLRVVGLATLLLAGNIAFHIEAHLQGTAEYGARIGIASIVLLIVVIGGRIVPSFTRNWLARETPGRVPAPVGRFDVAVIIITAATLALWIAQPIGRLTGAALAVTAVLNIMRLARWAGDRTCRERLVLILHVGYAFVPLGFVLSSAAALEIVMPSAAVHAWTVGAAGTMTLAVMTRATLGHTGNPLVASPMTQAIFAAVVIAAFARICASLQPAWSDILLHVTALAWCVAFFGFAASFGQMLVGRQRAKSSAQ
jgi:uncharacterized protein involved in response to NO